MFCEVVELLCCYVLCMLLMNVSKLVILRGVFMFCEVVELLCCYCTTIVGNYSAKNLSMHSKIAELDTTYTKCNAIATAYMQIMSMNVKPTSFSNLNVLL